MAPSGRRNRTSSWLSLVIEGLAFGGLVVFRVFAPLPSLALVFGGEVFALIMVLLRSLGAGRSARHGCLRRDYSQVLDRIMGLLRLDLEDHFCWIRPIPEVAQEQMGARNQKDLERPWLGD